METSLTFPVEDEFLISVGVLLTGSFKSSFPSHSERSGADLQVFGFCSDEEVFTPLPLVHWVECSGCFS